MAYLSESQKEQFWREGVLVVEDAVSNADLTALRTVFQEWVDESRDHLSDYGKHWMVEHGLTFNLAIAPRCRGCVVCNRPRKYRQFLPTSCERLERSIFAPS